MIVRDILALKGSEIFSISPASTVAEAIARMVEHNIGSLVILDGAGAMAGIVTERDVTRTLHKHGGTVTGLKVGELMTTRLITAGPEDTVDFVRGIMTENHIRHLPVVEDGKLLGLITFHDVAKSCLNEVNFENRLLKQYIKNWPE